VGEVIKRYTEEHGPGGIEPDKMSEEDRELWDAYIERRRRKDERFRKLFPRDSDYVFEDNPMHVLSGKCLLERVWLHLGDAVSYHQDFLMHAKDKWGEDDVFTESARSRIQDTKQDRRDFKAFIIKLRRRQLREED
jgi:hypothetical protein